jgi:plasmid stabilization system protein ParE
VARFRFSHRAEADLFNIGLYTFRTWGEIQTDRYIRQLEDCCQLLADIPRSVASVMKFALGCGA